MKKKMYYSAAALVMLFGFTGCGSCSGDKSCGAKSEATSTEQTVAADGHTSQNALDYEGIYIGTLPCADCEGILTEITLKDDTYHIRTTYLGVPEGQPNVFEDSGRYSWDPEGFVITLEDKNTPNQYQVGENVLFALDIEGKRITGNLADKYKLVKQ